MTNIVLQSRFFLITWLFRLLMLLDNLLLNLCRASYRVFVYASRITLISGDQIELFTNRVYLILGIALVFIIAYNLLSYIVDPEKISDKKAGAGAFIKNVIISLTIIVITPMAFVKLYSFQNTIITQGIIANIIMGVPSNDSGSEDNQEELTNSKKAEEFLDKGAKNITATVYSSFVLPTDNDFNAFDCPSAESLTEANQAYCDAYFYMQETGSNSKFSSLIDDYEDEFDYYFLVSTAGVLVMLFFFASYCIELGKRAGKLAILQLLAPIPVAMEVVPGKSGSRQKWLNEVVSTFLDVFIYQATVFIVIYLLQFVGPAIQNLFATAYSGTTGVITTIERTFALVFLMFGLFKFGKDVPKMIEDLIGIKGAGSFGDVWKRSLAMAGVSGGLLGSNLTRFTRNFNQTDGNPLQKIGSGLAGVGSGIVRTLWGARNVHSIKDANNQRRKINTQVTAARVDRANYTSRGQGSWWEGHRIRTQEHREDRIAARHERWGGNTFDESNQLLSALNTLSTKNDLGNFKLTDDSEYADMDKRNRELKLAYQTSRDNFNNLEAASSNLAAEKAAYFATNPTHNDDQFYSWLEHDSQAATIRDSYSNIIDARNEMLKNKYAQEYTENTALPDMENKVLLKDKKVNAVKQSAVDVLTELKGNALLSDLRDSNGNKFVDVLSRLINDKGQLLDPNGQVITNPTAAHIKALRNVTKDLAKIINDKSTQINIERSGQRREAELREARKKNNGNN